MFINGGRYILKMKNVKSITAGGISNQIFSFSTDTDSGFSPNNIDMTLLKKPTAKIVTNKIISPGTKG